MADVQLLHTRSKDKANEEAFVAPLKEATAVWLGGGDQSKIAEAYLGTAVERELLALLARGGVIGGTSAGAAIQSKTMIAGGQTEPQMGTGFDLLPGRSSTSTSRPASGRIACARRWPIIRATSARWGSTSAPALIVQGRLLTVIGNSSVSVLPGCRQQPPRV